MAFVLKESTKASRSALLDGPKATLTLELSEGREHRIPDLPRRMLFAFSKLAGKQLHATEGKTVRLGVNACTPAALEYLIFWMKKMCWHPEPAPLQPMTDWRGTIMVYKAALALDVPEAEKQLGQWIAAKISEMPLGVADFVCTIENLPRGHRVVGELVRKTAYWRRMALLPERREMDAYLLEERPDLFTAFNAIDKRATVNGYIARERQAVIVARVHERARMEREQERKEAAQRRVAEEEEKREDGEAALARQRRAAGIS